MSQVFSADGVASAANVSIPTTSETTSIVGNFLSPPFQNGKAVIQATIHMLVGTGTTSLAVRIRRNPSAENFIVTQLVSTTATAGNIIQLSFSGVDTIPDGRAVQYGATVTQVGATGNGNIDFASITAMLISG